MRIRLAAAASLTALTIAGLVGGIPTAAAAPPAEASGRHADDVVDHWTPDRRAEAQPRDLLVDQRGLGYLRRADGGLASHGHTASPAIPAPTAVAGAADQGPRAAAPVPQGKPSGGSADTEGPAVAGMDPGDGAVVGASHTFAATVTDPSGVRSVSFVIVDQNEISTTLPATAAADGRWTVAVQGFTDGAWTWSVLATDRARGSGNTSESPQVHFQVDTAAPQLPPSEAGDASVVTNAEWRGGTVQTAAGRIYFEMPTRRNQRSWAGYVCSGTVVQDDAGEQSVILTAAHCVYDDVNKAFARNVLFIPDQASTTGTATDTDCTNDRLGCWAPGYGVVDQNWTSRTFPDNSPWDYAFYVVPTTGAHAGTATSSESLEDVAGTLPISFNSPVGGRTHALGYSYIDDPEFRYCAEDVTAIADSDLWLPHCGLSRGASGGPWVQPLDSITGVGPIVSVNSWAYTGQPGMAGPDLADSSAEGLFTHAQSGTALTEPRGVVITGG